MNKTIEAKNHIFSTNWLLHTSKVIFLSGISMWIVGGLWHNLILPTVNQDVEAHHDGLVVMLISYFILAGLMLYFFLNVASDNSKIRDGFKTGVIIGILWVFPHGLAMAGVHDTSIIYELKNTLYHMVEQGIGGAVIGLTFKLHLNGSKTIL